MEYLRKKYLESVEQEPKLAHFTANLKPITSMRTPMLAQKSAQIKSCEKNNGLDSDMDLTKSIVRKTKRSNGKLLTKSTKPITKIKKRPKNLPEALDQRIFDEPSSKSENAVLHLKYKGDLAALVCQVRTANLGALKQRLAKVMQQYKSRFRLGNSKPCMFAQVGLIHAHMTSNAVVDFADLEAQLQRAARQCNATDCKVVSIEMGALCFRCLPEDILEVAAKLRLSGYKPLLTEVGYCAKGPLVRLTLPQMQRYSQFIKALEADADVIKVYDNVHNSMLYSMFTS